MLLTGLVFIALLIQTREDGLFYVIPDPPSTTDCIHNLSCTTFQDFIDNHQLDEENFTLEFLKGHHTLPEIGDPTFMRYVYVMQTSHLTMVGKDAEVIIHDISVAFLRAQELQIKDLTLRNGIFHISMAKGKTELNLFSVTLIDFLLSTEDVTRAQLNNCKFYSGATPLTVYKTHVVLSGDTHFFSNYNSAIASYSSTVTLSGTISFINNSGIRGGAMALYTSTIYLRDGLNASFINNSAQETGGAIHIEPDITRDFCFTCFYETQKHPTDITFHFSGNVAKLGGDNIYGTSLDLCERLHANNKDNVIKSFSPNVSMSSVSSDPMKVCLCSDGQPRCKKLPRTLTSKSVHPGETFTIPAVLVGGDYGTTTGAVHASFTSTNLSSVLVLEADHQYNQWISNVSTCTNLKYTVHSEQDLVMHLNVHISKRSDITNIDYEHCGNKYLSHYFNTPTLIDIIILPCPMGLSLVENPTTCDCNPILTRSGVKCGIINGKSYFSWNSTLWINVTDTDFIYVMYCPLHYCDPAGKQIELKSNPSMQCALNRAGRLCGGCREGYSLAIGSSHCIHCPNNNNGLALLIFFAAAGLLLVFFINVLDVTLTQGLLDGLIFYANIIWTYQSVLFPGEYRDTNAGLIFLKTFIAWINLDFGIETCFVKGLTAYCKTWLQFIFPLYLWAIVGLMIFSARHSRTLTKLYGTRAVPVLATLFLLSYMKLLRTVTSIYMFSGIWHYPQKRRTTVWSVDGNIDYFGLPHSFLLVAALLVQTLLWFPYTLCLLFYQLLQKVSHIRTFKWVTNQKPFFDVHFAPFKPSHRYWFGVLLLARGVLLVAFSSIFAAPKNANLLLLLITILLLLLYMAIVQPYKNKIVLIIESTFLANILLLSAFTLYAETKENKHKIQTAAVGISIGVAFLQFCGIVGCNVIRLCFCKRRRSHRYRADFEDEMELNENFVTTYRAYIMNALF